MIYREMPATWDPHFRPTFYARWGKEAAVVSARARRVEYPDYQQLLSIKTAFGGAENYVLDGRRISVDDDTFVIFNQGRTYASRIDGLQPVHSFSIFFDTRLAAQVWPSLSQSVESALDDPSRKAHWPIEFSEQLHHHDKLVSPVLRHIRDEIDAGMDDRQWLEEQLLFLLERMIRLHYKTRTLESIIPSTKATTRRELFRRLALGVDFIHSQYRESVDLQDIATAARLSPFHFLRTFKVVHGMTPIQYLGRKRAAAALRLLNDTSWTTTTIAAYVGLGNRTNLFRHMSAVYGLAPRDLRAKGRN